MKKIVILIIISIILGVFTTWIISLAYSKTDECGDVWHGYPVWVKWEEPKEPIIMNVNGELIGLGCSTSFVLENPEITGWFLDTLFWGTIIFLILLISTKLITKEKKSKKSANNDMKIKKILLLALLILLIPLTVFAHPGRTDAKGCHICKTNCSKWKIKKGTKHCHKAKYQDKNLQKDFIDKQLIDKK